MNKFKCMSAAAGLLAILPGLLAAQELMIYPAKGQSSEKQEKDKFECYSFAKNQSSFDPMAPPTTSTAGSTARSATWTGTVPTTC